MLFIVMCGLVLYIDILCFQCLSIVFFNIFTAGALMMSSGKPFHLLTTQMAKLCCLFAILTGGCFSFK